MTIDRAYCLRGPRYPRAWRSRLHSPMWLLLTAFVGLNLIQASFTGFCPAAMIFKPWGNQGGNGVPVRSGERSSNLD